MKNEMMEKLNHWKKYNEVEIENLEGTVKILVNCIEMNTKKIKSGDIGIEYIQRLMESASELETAVEKLDILKDNIKAIDKLIEIESK